MFWNASELISSLDQCLSEVSLKRFYVSLSIQMVEMQDINSHGLKARNMKEYMPHVGSQCISGAS